MQLRDVGAADAPAQAGREKIDQLIAALGGGGPAGVAMFWASKRRPGGVRLSRPLLNADTGGGSTEGMAGAGAVPAPVAELPSSPAVANRVCIAFQIAARRAFLDRTVDQAGQRIAALRLRPVHDPLSQ